MHTGRVYKIEEEKHNLKNQDLTCNVNSVPFVEIRSELVDDFIKAVHFMKPKMKQGYFKFSPD